MSEIKVGLYIENSQVSFETNQIIGYIESIIIESDNKIEIIIESSLGYPILKDANHIGVKYFIPRGRISSPDAGMRDRLSFDKFLLNESIIITAIGPKKTQINLIIRTI